MITIPITTILAIIGWFVLGLIMAVPFGVVLFIVADMIFGSEFVDRHMERFVITAWILGQVLIWTIYATTQGWILWAKVENTISALS